MLRYLFCGGRSKDSGFNLNRREQAEYEFDTRVAGQYLDPEKWQEEREKFVEQWLSTEEK